MASVSDSYWYDSSADEYVIPLVSLGDLSQYGDGSSNPHGVTMGMATAYSGTMHFKSVENPQTFPAQLNP